MRFPVDNLIPQDYNKPIIQAERSDSDDVQSFLQHGNDEYFCVRSQCERWPFLRTYRLHFHTANTAMIAIMDAIIMASIIICGLIISLRAIALIAILVLVVGLIIQEVKRPGVMS